MRIFAILCAMCPALSAAATAMSACGRNVTFLGPWSGGDAWLVNYTGPFVNDRPPHVQLGAHPNVTAGQVACLSKCGAATSEAIEWQVDGVWNNALNRPAHMTVYYGPGAAGKVSQFCAPPSEREGVVCKAGSYYKKYGPACGADCCECVAGNYCPGDMGGYEKMIPCPDGTCSPPGATAAAQCVAPACSGPAPSPGPGPGPTGGIGQVHLSLTGVVTEMQVSFAIPNFDCKNVTKAVAYGSSPSALNATAHATGYAFTDAGQPTPLCTFTAKLTGLAPDTTYYYAIDGGAVIDFRNQPARTGGRVYAVFGDMGLDNDVAAAQIVAEAAADEWDAIIYSGDYAYDLNDNGGATGDAFMDVMAPAAGRKPWMGVVGNHEEYFNFSQWKNRFWAYREAAANSGSKSPFWYSFDDGLVHFVCINTELYEYGGADPAEQLAWLDADLAAVDRSRTPWLIVNGHKNAFMPQVDFTKLDALLRAHGVDLYVNGHAHNYQRIVPFEADLATPAHCRGGGGSGNDNVYAGCSSYVNVVVGSPGNREIASKGDNTRKAPASLLPVFSENFGFARLTVNETALHFQWEQVKAWDAVRRRLVRGAASFADEFWVTH